MNSFNNNVCNVISVFTNPIYQSITALQTQIKNIIDQLQTDKEAVQNTKKCINTVYSLINYSYTFSPPSIGLVRYNNINITNSSVGNRIWNFTYGGYLSLSQPPYKFTTTYTFDPNCFVPNNVDLATLNQINFNSLNGDGTPEPLQGFIIINNVNIPLSDSFSSPNSIQEPLATFTWDQVNTIFELKINLTNYIQKVNYNPQGKNSIFVNLWIQDLSCNLSCSCTRFTCTCTSFGVKTTVDSCTTDNCYCGL